MIHIQNLIVKYNDITALDINQVIHIEENDRIGVIGSNGSGKTTLVKALLGLVKYEGYVETQLSHQQMAVHLQHNHYIETVKIKSIIEALLTKEQLVSEAYLSLVEYFDFKACLNKKYQQLSGGQKQRLTIILVLMQDAPVTYFDEVTTGLDFETRHALMEKIITWYEHKKSSILLVTHYYEELDRLANKLLILHQGKVIDFGLKETLFKKYCGYSVIVYPKQDINLFPQRQRIIAPQLFEAMSCESSHDEMSVIKVLNDKSINFKRTNHDIELLYLNAIAGEDK